MIARVFACDHRDIQPGTATVYSSMSQIADCPAVSRAATTDPVLRTVAGRDGWALLPDGRHLCPTHAAAAEGAA